VSVLGVVARSLGSMPATIACDVGHLPAAPDLVCGGVTIHEIPAGRGCSARRVARQNLRLVDAGGRRCASASLTGDVRILVVLFD
jgi:hypothetical protein